jgi:hypothetical protein
VLRCAVLSPILAGCQRQDARDSDTHRHYQEKDRVKHHVLQHLKGWGVVSTLALLLSVSQSLAAQPLGASAAPTRSVTLITGDRVSLSGNGREVVNIRRALGREDVRIVTRKVTLSGQDSHLYVIPEDAAPLIAAGKVDRRLFDVTLLLQFGYDDAHRQDLPFTVT